ncbi:MAG: hypothetical protein JWO56_360 [Acidobacteria bacterium]|nr:hypothetical protein [Acidobacteriota bacterium]
MKKAVSFTVATVTYALFWIVTRWPAIRANVLFFDDFELPLRPGDFYTGGFRPTLHLEYAIWELLVPNHFWTILPKFAGAVYIGISAALLIQLLREWDVDPLIAALLPLVVIANPILADGPLWQTYTCLPIAYALITAGAIAWSRGHKWAFALLTLAGILGYQIFLTLAVVYAIAEPVIRRRFHLRDFIQRMVLLGALAGVQVAVMVLIRRYYHYSDNRGFVTTFDLRAQIHGMFDLLVNGWMPVIAYYTGAVRAMSLWKYVPLILGALAGLTTRRVAPAIFAATIFIIPTLPNLVIGRAPYSWRVSLPEAFALALALLPILMSIGRRAAAAVIVAVTLLMIPVSHYESWCRAESFLRDQAFVESIRQHWKGRDFTVVLAPVNPEKIEDVSLIGPHDLTWGYERRSSRMWSELNDPWMAKRYVRNYARMKFVDCNEEPASAVCLGSVPACDRGCSDAPVRYPRSVHDEALRITIVCPLPARQAVPAPPCAAVARR